MAYVESRGNKSFDDYPPVRYCTPQDVYDATGLAPEFLGKLGKNDPTTITNLVNGYIERVSERIRRLLGVPIAIRKEGHAFFNNTTVQLGPDREDMYEMDDAYDPIGKVVEVHRLFLNNYLLKTPFPRNMDMFTEEAFINNWAVVENDSEIENLVVADREDFKCGESSVHITFNSNKAVAVCPKLRNLNKRIYPWFYVGFWFKTDRPEVKLQFRIKRSNGDYFYGVFSTNGQLMFNAEILKIQGYGELENTWVPMGLNIRGFRPSSGINANQSPKQSLADFNWILVPTQCIEIAIHDEQDEGVIIDADNPVNIWIDNLNFNDGLYANYPEGTVVWSMPNFYPSGRVEVSYTYDPFLGNRTNGALVEAASKLAGVKLIDWCIGKRQMYIAFDHMSDTLEESADKVTLEATRKRLELEAEEALRVLGYGYTSGLA